MTSGSIPPNGGHIPRRALVAPVTAVKGRLKRLRSHIKLPDRRQLAICQNFAGFEVHELIAGLEIDKRLPTVT